LIPHSSALGTAFFTACLSRARRFGASAFNIQKNVLFLLDLVEKEEVFYVFEKNVLQQKEGYYVYYEKNPQMQEYMIEQRKSQELNISPEEIQEPFVHSYRETLLEKKVQLSERKWNGVLYTTSLLLVLSVCVLGVSTVNNVEKMQDLESVVNQISGKGGQAGVQSLDVPAMSANVQDQDQADVNEAGSSKTDNSHQKETDKVKDAETSVEGQEGKDDLDIEGQTVSDDDSTIDDDSEIDDSSNEEDDEKDVEQTSALTEAQTSLLQGYYIVKKGESLVGISKKIYGTAAKARKICELNGIEDMDMIYAGQKLELP